MKLSVAAPLLPTSSVSDVPAAGSGAWSGPQAASIAATIPIASLKPIARLLSVVCRDASAPAARRKASMIDREATYFGGAERRGNPTRTLDCVATLALKSRGGNMRHDRQYTCNDQLI